MESRPLFRGVPARHKQPRGIIDDFKGVSQPKKPNVWSKFYRRGPNIEMTPPGPSPSSSNVTIFDSEVKALKFYFQQIEDLLRAFRLIAYVVEDPRCYKDMDNWHQWMKENVMSHWRALWLDTEWAVNELVPEEKVSRQTRTGIIVEAEHSAKKEELEAVGKASSAVDTPVGYNYYRVSWLSLTKFIGIVFSDIQDMLRVLRLSQSQQDKAVVAWHSDLMNKYCDMRNKMREYMRKQLRTFYNLGGTIGDCSDHLTPIEIFKGKINNASKDLENHNASDELSFLLKEDARRIREELQKLNSATAPAPLVAPEQGL
ncbi:Protein of unknown function [Pyronema omphalodes CBS 100304]|uniref:Uncharacterized protein n=1 Tax=Pyronema omphalodes (strain CBS 100304) TaxID=1076935 RepID=U4LPN8_PYROM|nr:Protein of unknown function [Pyronema omphalodes CBS 100304]